MATPGNIQAPETYEKASIILECPPSKFGEFITGLLGKSQTISKTFSGNFTVKLEDIENFYHLLEQKMKEQYKFSLLQFQASVYYEDGSSISVNSLSQLK